MTIVEANFYIKARTWDVDHECKHNRPLKVVISELQNGEKSLKHKIFCDTNSGYH